MHDRYNHECLAIFTPVAEHGDPEAAKTMEARRLGIIRKQASPDVLLNPC